MLLCFLVRDLIGFSSFLCYDIYLISSSTSSQCAFANNVYIVLILSHHLECDLIPYATTGDVAGIGWERSEGTPPPPGQAPKGRVYFTYCGQRLSPVLEDVAGGMWPLVHIQKKVFYVKMLLFSFFGHTTQIGLEVKILPFFPFTELKDTCQLWKPLVLICRRPSTQKCG